jgi:hypothetical protein
VVCPSREENISHSYFESVYVVEIDADIFVDKSNSITFGRKPLVRYIIILDTGA